MWRAKSLTCVFLLICLLVHVVSSHPRDSGRGTGYGREKGRHRSGSRDRSEVDKVAEIERKLLQECQNEFRNEVNNTKYYQNILQKQVDDITITAKKTRNFRSWDDGSRLIGHDYKIQLILPSGKRFKLKPNEDRNEKSRNAWKSDRSLVIDTTNPKDCRKILESLLKYKTDLIMAIKNNDRKAWWGTWTTHIPFDSVTTKYNWRDSLTTRNPWRDSKSTKNPYDSWTTGPPWWDTRTTQNPHGSWTTGDGYWHPRSTTNKRWDSWTTRDSWRKSQTTENPYDSKTTRYSWWDTRRTDYPDDSWTSRPPWWDSWTTRNPYGEWTTEDNRRGSRTTENNWWTTRNPWKGSQTTENPYDSWTTRNPYESWTTRNPYESWTTRNPYESWTTKGNGRDFWTIPETTTNWNTGGPLTATNQPTDASTEPIPPTYNLRDCSEILKYESNPKESNVYPIMIPAEPSFLTALVSCDMNTRPGGWTIIQKRKDGTTDFYRTWEEYEDGFGYPLTDYWMGLEKQSALTRSRAYKLRIEMTDSRDRKYYAEYSRFIVGGASTNYTLLSIGRYSGTAGDSLSYHVGQQFTTFDVDNDAVAENNCARIFHGAWWFKYCHESNLNGEFEKSITWRTLTGYYTSLKSTTMMIAPVTTAV